MNTISLLAAQAWVDRLGWTLLHFLWQGTLIAVVYAAARRAARSRGPNARYLLACGALLCMAAAPIVTWMAWAPEVPLPGAGIGHAAASPTAGVAVGAFAAAIVGAPLAPEKPFLPWVVAFWFAGAVGFWVRLTGGWIVAVRLRTVLARPAPAPWQQILDQLKSRLGVAVPVRLLVSAFVPAPTVVGWLRPVVLVPLGALTGLPAAQIEALLVHELAHIRRADYLVNLLQGVVEALLFYHPAVWWVSGQIRAEREMCCDDVAVGVCGDVLTYASALAELESARLTHFRAAMAATGGTLADRIARLLGQPRATSSRPANAAALVLLAVTAMAVFAQPAARPKFEVASIRPAPDQGFQRVRPLPGRLSAVASVRILMQNAYTLQPFQIVNAPEWVASDRYEVEAKAEGNADRAQIFLMVQSLLEDRFRLKVHHETRELPVYTLVAAKGGPKLPAPKEGSCVSADASPNWAGGRIPPPGQDRPPASPCGGVMVMLEQSGARMQGGKVPMSELVRTLTLVLGRMVIDKTGYTQLFDVKLDFLPDAISSALPPPPPGASVDPNQPSIVTALQERLGLKLESAKGPVDVLVIDHVERPTAN
jgi:uncharacterized protein (TIGR03435 family)